MASKERMKQILRLLIERDGFICGICENELTDIQEADVDHIIPKILGGMDKSENVQPAHKVCNRRKNGDIYPHLKQKPKHAGVDRLFKQKEFIESEFLKQKEKDKNFEFVSQAIERKKRADEFLEQVIKKNKILKTKTKNIPKIIPLIIEKVDSDSPVRLWNELARNGFKNLSYNIFLQHFTEYRKAKGTFNNTK